MISEEEYFNARKKLLDSPETILEIELEYMKLLIKIISEFGGLIAIDFNQALLYKPYWINYVPKQRGRSPSGLSIPWSEVGETAIGANLIKALTHRMPEINFPGLPSGADIRFRATKAIVHLDVKVTGPNDRADEIVASPNQISGDGAVWDNGILNSSVQIRGQNREMIFQPELPPFYLVNGEILLCLTYFLKAVYKVKEYAEQPLSYMELICVPNGLLSFAGPRYIEQKGLFIPGKDVLTHLKKRTRVRMEPLASLDKWRRSLIWSESE